MKTLIAILFAVPVIVSAQWTLCIQGPTPLTNSPDCASVSVLPFDKWRSDDVQDYVKAGYPVPNQFPALVHLPSKTVANAVTNIAQAKAMLLTNIPQTYGVTNAVASWRAASSNAVAITGGKRGLGGMRAGKTITDPLAQQAYTMAAIDALSARIEMLEAIIKRAGLCPPEVIAGDAP